jgi:acetyl/propionyl-CoA carboxylase alpha subunit
MPDTPKAFKVKANEFVFVFDQTDIDAIDIIQTSPTNFNLIKAYHSVNAHLLEADNMGKRMKVEIDGEIFDLEVKDSLEQMLEQMGYHNSAGKQIKEIKAPMPGLVLSVTVEAGQEVEEGDRLLILEAMKMENSILIHAKARIKRVAVKAGQAVEKGQVLVELD